jgi:hypothetical protein
VLGDGDEAGRAHAELGRLAPEPLRELARCAFVRHRDALGAELSHLLGEPRDVAAGRERRHAEALGELERHRERLLPDAARAPEQREPLHRPAPLRTCALVRPKRRSRRA